MAEEFIGCHLSVECLNNLGVFQGKLMSVSKDSGFFELGNSIRNGKKCESPTVLISSSDVANLRIIRDPSPPLKERSDERNVGYQKEQYRSDPRKAFDEGRQKPFPGRSTPTTPTRKGARYNNSTFDVPVSQLGEFDFEANLALFDKNAFKNESNLPAKKETNFKHNENVIPASAPARKEIVLPELSEKEFQTDSGLVVSSISPSLRALLEKVVDEAGITQEKRVELTARAVTELSLQLVGSHCRFEPKNSHQRPKAVILCGAHSGTPAAICSARHLAAQGFRTVLLLPADNIESKLAVAELVLYSKTGGMVARQVQALRDEEPDLIVCCLEEAVPRFPPMTDRFVNEASDWANRQRAPKLILDPPVHKNATLDAKATVVPYLPLAHGEERGLLYLMNFSIPKGVFNSVGITFSPPFGARFLISLHQT